jgi:hypothetical protein
MRRRPVIVLVVVVVLAAIAVPALSAVAPTGHAAAAKVTVRPAVGTPHTRFVVSFVTPGHLGPAAAFTTRYAVTASDRRQSGCVSTASAMIASSLRGIRLKLSLDPPRGASWCAGKFNARIQEYQTPVCLPLRLCPMFIRFVGTVATFSFRVERAG